MTHALFNAGLLFTLVVAGTAQAQDAAPEPTEEAAAPAPTDEPAATPDEPAAAPDEDVDAPADASPTEEPAPVEPPPEEPPPPVSSTLPPRDDPAPPRTGKPRVAVMDFAQQEGASEALGLSLASLAATRLDGLRVFDVITENDVRHLVDFEAVRVQMSGELESRLEDIGKTLGADYLLGGTVYGAGPVRVDVVLYDLGTFKAVRREIAEAKDPRDIVRPFTRKVDRVIAPVLAARQGRLYLRVSEEGAEVRLDGDVIGNAPLPAREIGSGPHTISVAKEGFVKSDLDVVLTPDHSQSVEIVLIPSQEYVAHYKKRAWLWRGTAYGLFAATGASLATAGTLLLLDTVRTPQIAEETNQKELNILRLRAAHFWELQTYRWGGYGALALAPALAIAGAVVYVASDDPGRYDDLITETE